MTPKTARRFHMAGMVIWGSQIAAVGYLMWPPDWKMYLVEISLAANFIGHWSGLDAARPTEIIQEEVNGST